MNEIILKTISARYTAAARDMGDLKEIRGGLFRFSCESYSLDGIGNLFFIRMRAMAGLIKMETAVLTPVERDLSFCNFDVVHAAGTHTMIFEMYRTCMEERDLSAFAPIRETYRQLPDYESAPRWYDEFRLPPSIGKRGRGIAPEGERMLLDCLRQYLDVLDAAPECDAEAKRAQNRIYVDRLLREGGMAVDNMKKIIGVEKTERLVRTFMYDV